MKGRLRAVGAFGVVLCFAASAFGQAGAPTQRVKIPGIPEGTSIYAKAPNRASNFTSVGCVSKTSDGGFQITDWRGAGGSNGAGAPAFQAREPLVLRLQGDRDMLNFQVGHEVEVKGPILADAKEDHPAEMRAESILYLSRTCWKRGTNSADANQPRR